MQHEALCASVLRDWFLLGSRARYLGLQISPRVQVQEADEGTIAKELPTFRSRWFLIIRDVRGERNSVWENEGARNKRLMETRARIRPN